MAKTKTSKSPLSYIQQLLEDEFVQEQLHEAIGGLREAYLRARSQRAKATEDKHLYGNLRKAATSIRNAGSALQRREPPPKRRKRKALTVALAVAGCVAMTIRLQKLQSRQAGASQASTGGVHSFPTAGTDAAEPATRSAVETAP
jgi:ferric-dicitrate binding protein FerR (iron transport regulator)